MGDEEKLGWAGAWFYCGFVREAGLSRQAEGPSPGWTLILGGAQLPRALSFAAQRGPPITPHQGHRLPSSSQDEENREGQLSGNAELLLVTGIIAQSGPEPGRGLQSGPTPPLYSLD